MPSCSAGIAYSSLSYLNRYVTDTIKIDKSFVKSLCSDDRTLAIVLLIIQLAKTLDVDVVAEGVETEEQAQLLASMSCARAQGFYSSPPVTAEAATVLIASSLPLNWNECSIAPGGDRLTLHRLAPSTITIVLTAGLLFRPRR